jgi:hypothetical protein
LIVVLSSIVGCGDGKSPEEIADGKRVQEEKPIEVNALEFTRTFEPVSKGDEKYKDKVVQIIGKIDKVSKSEQEKASYVKLEGGGHVVVNGTSYPWSVSCKFTGDDRKTADSLSSGSQVKIKGICTGAASDYPHIRLKACKVVQ